MALPLTAPRLVSYRPSVRAFLSNINALTVLPELPAQERVLEIQGEGVCPLSYIYIGIGNIGNRSKREQNQGLASYPALTWPVSVLATLTAARQQMGEGVR